MSAKILTHSGYWFDLEHPETSYISIDDIAHGLSNACRFAGQCFHFYSVAQHCVNVSYAVDDERLALAALLHDASEAYTGDMSSPLKSLCPEFRKIEDRIQAEICRRFCIPVEENYRIKQEDTRVLIREREMLFNHNWKMPSITHFGFRMALEEPMLTGEAKAIFKKRFRDISKHD